MVLMSEVDFLIKLCNAYDIMYAIIKKTKLVVMEDKMSLTQSLTRENWDHIYRKGDVYIFKKSCNNI
jgi:ActR/RegA family two-component response regulator